MICEGCVDRTILASPINGVVYLSHSKGKMGNSLHFWAAYNTPMTEVGCIALRKNELATVDLSTYQAPIDAM